MKKVLLLLLLTTMICSAQPEKGKFGLSAVIQSSQFDFMLPIFTQETISVAPMIGVAGSNSNWDFSGGIAARIYFSKNIVTPYVGARGGMLLFIPKEGDIIADFIFGPLFGAEYFVNKHFSCGIELQVVVTESNKKSLRFGNAGGTTVHTSTAVFATIFF